MKNITQTISHKPSIIFFGTDHFSLISLKALIQAGYNIAAIVTKPDSKSGRGQKLSQPVVKEFAIKNQISFWQPTNPSEINEIIKCMPDDRIGVLASYGKLVPQSTIDLFKPGIINVHPSLLPKYRGPTPIESAIENGDAKTGVSIIMLTDQMDAGPVYDQAIYNLDGSETQPYLYDALAKLGADRLVKVLPDIIEGSLKPNLQDNLKAIYCSLLTKDRQWLLPDTTSAPQAERQVRAHLVYPRTKIEINSHIITITKAHVTDGYLSPLTIKCSDSKYLAIDELIAPSGRTMSAKAFMNGYLS